jgi:hypothetical protein
MIRLRRLQRQKRDRFMQIWATTSYSGHVRYFFFRIERLLLFLCYLIGALLTLPRQEAPYLAPRFSN